MDSRRLSPLNGLCQAIVKSLYSTVAPPGRQPRGAKVRSGESQRREREAARQDRLSESRKRRAAGEKP
jgi:hypothetical protein